MKQLFYKITTIFIFILVTGTIILWSWNNSVAAMFDLPRIQFKEALGLMLLSFCFSLLLRFGSHHMRIFKDGQL